MQNLKKLIALTEHKQKIDLKRGEAKYMDTNFLLDSITDEVEEVSEEIKPNNLAHFTRSHRSHRSCVGVYMRVKYSIGF